MNTWKRWSTIFFVQYLFIPLSDIYVIKFTTHLSPLPWNVCCKLYNVALHDKGMKYAWNFAIKKNHTSGLQWTDRVDMTYLYGTLRTCYPDELGLHVLVRNGPIAWGSWFISVLNALYFRPPNVRHFSYCAPVSCNGFSIKLPTPYFPLLDLWHF